MSGPIRPNAAGVEVSPQPELSAPWLAVLARSWWRRCHEVDALDADPTEMESLTTEDLLLLVKRRLDRLYELLGTGN